jgi:hypothetical protein
MATVTMQKRGSPLRLASTRAPATPPSAAERHPRAPATPRSASVRSTLTSRAAVAGIDFSGLESVPAREVRRRRQSSPMTRGIGVGVIGLGWMGRVHASAYRRVLEHFPDLEAAPRLVAAADVSAQRRAHAEHVGFERTAADWRAVIEDPAVDVISVTVPNAMHRAVALAAIEAGKPVWVEKPVGRGLEDAAAVGRLDEDGQRSVVLAIVRREIGVMAASALVVALLGVRAAGGL